MPKARYIALIGVIAVMTLCVTSVEAVQAQHPGITHKLLFRSILPDTANQEVTVWETEYAPGAVNPCHMHPAAITFYILSGTGIWQVVGKKPATLHAGDSLFAPAGTVHSHWNPSTTERLTFLEFIVAEKGKGRSIPCPVRK